MQNSDWQRVVALQQHLRLAQHQLHDHQRPFQLVALSYLRICCTAICRYHQRQSFNRLDAQNLYLTLLNRLTQRHPEWWQLCYVSDYGYLISGDRHIRDLLQPLNTFLEKILDQSPRSEATYPADAPTCSEIQRK